MVNNLNSTFFKGVFTAIGRTELICVPLKVEVNSTITNVYVPNAIKT